MKKLVILTTTVLFAFMLNTGFAQNKKADTTKTRGTKNGSTMRDRQHDNGGATNASPNQGTQNMNTERPGSSGSSGSSSGSNMNNQRPSGSGSSGNGSSGSGSGSNGSSGSGSGSNNSPGSSGSGSNSPGSGSGTPPTTPPKK